jgi:uncharacterized protein
LTLQRPEPPEIAAWRLVDAHDGFEVLFRGSEHDGHRFDGHSVGIEKGELWSVRYTLRLDADWRPRSAHVIGQSQAGVRELRLAAVQDAGWRVDGERAPELDGCLDIDLEGSAFTNALPVQRLRLAVGQDADAPAVYVRALDLAVERLEQRYARLEDESGRSRYEYESPANDFWAVLAYDQHGLVLDYPGIARRVA